MKYCLLIILVALLLLTLVLQGVMYLSGSRDVVSTVVKSDAVVLLSGSYKERAPAAAMLVRNGYADRLILTNDGVFSGWSTKYNRNLYQIEWAEEELVSCGVPREKIVKLPERVNSTMSEAMVASRYARVRGLKKIILVTSDYHAGRALWSFKKAFAGYPADVMVSTSHSSAGKERVQLIEFGKMMYYQVRYVFVGM